MNSPVGAISPLQIRSAIAFAADRTGVDFDYLLTTAKRESGLKTDAKSKSSSASGLFQFIDQTWLSTLKKHGPKHGLEALADQISVDEKGRFNVADPKAREEILALRHDPRTASLMAGELTRDAAGALAAKLGRAASQGELYLAHFLGPSGAARFIAASERNPEGLAAQTFSREAAANRSIFFEASGKMRTLSEVYNRLTNLHQDKASEPAKMAINTVESQVQVTSPERPPARPATVAMMPAQPTVQGIGYQGLGALTTRLTPQVLMILSSLDLPFMSSGDRF